MSNEKVYAMKLSKVYPLLLNKCLRKNRTEEELIDVINWLTGYQQNQLKQLISEDISYSDFFKNAPCLNPNRKKITGKICGISVEEIKEPLMQEIRYLDKLVDELAKGRSIDKIMRS